MPKAVTEQEVEQFLSECTREYHAFFNRVICVEFRHPNGFVIGGRSGTIDDSGFDPAVGLRLATEDAKRKVWFALAFAKCANQA